VIDPLSRLPEAKIYAVYLQEALLQAEDIYISTTPYAEETSDPQIFQMKTDIPEMCNRSRSLDLLRFLLEGFQRWYLKSTEWLFYSLKRLFAANQPSVIYTRTRLGQTGTYGDI
jgi:hypothetical protein